MRTVYALLAAVVILAGAAWFGFNQGWFMAGGEFRKFTRDDVDNVPITKSDAVEFGKTEGGIDTVTVSGQLTLFAPPVTVDPSKEYRVVAEVRVLPDANAAPATSRIYAGVQTYDESGKVILSGPGTFRYAAANNVTLSSDQGWTVLEGIIVGEGDGNHNQFRPGTKRVRAIVLPNFEGPGLRTEIRKISVSPVDQGGSPSAL